jgi:hypothetical protein
MPTISTTYAVLDGILIEKKMFSDCVVRVLENVFVFYYF